MKINLHDIFNLKDSVIYNPDNYKSVSRVSIDSRTIKKNSLYVAIKGNKYDGHKFIKDAITNGATSILINKSQLKKYSNLDCTIITVPNTTMAYGELAKIYRNKFSGQVISITGSNGKTTTKEILSTILNEKFHVVKTNANDNNHIGIPKTIFSITNKTEKLVLEHGTNHFSEIEYSANIASPDISLITNIGDSHLEYLKNRMGVLNEKKSLFDQTLKNDGKIFVNSDDKLLRSVAKKNKNKLTFGFRGKPNYKGKIDGYSQNGNTKLSIEYFGKHIAFTVPLYGISNAKNVLAATSIALYLGVSQRMIKSGIKKLQQIKGRLFLEKFKNFILIDDTYNSNPTSVKAAIELLNRIKLYKIKSLIIGDMYELGEDSEKMHSELAKQIIKNKINNVFIIGKMMKTLYLELENKHTNAVYFPSRKALYKFIGKYNYSEQIVLVKGSRGMKMEDFVNQIRENMQ